MTMGGGGSAMPHFLSALSSAPKTGLKVSALTQTPAANASAVPLVQTAAGGDESGAAMSAVPTPTVVQASAAPDEKVVYSAL
ncbi:hypothetical protein TSMEX_008548 [Taenia solium]|eukprot:TsM_000636700 transcript=TsM_000636700 gene=TsM_000636700